MGHKEAQQVLDDAEYAGLKLFLLYRVAEVVNPHHDFEYWQRPEVAARELNSQPGTIRKYMSSFVDDGWLVVLEAGGGRGKNTRYGWVYETATPVAVYEAVQETATGVQETATGVQETATGVQETATGVRSHYLLEKKEEEGEERTKHAGVSRSYSDSFDAFWADYQRKGNKFKTAQHWSKLSAADRCAAHKSLPFYFIEKPEAKYRLDGERFLRDRRFDNYDGITRDQALALARRDDSATETKSWTGKAAARAAKDLKLDQLEMGQLEIGTDQTSLVSRMAATQPKEIG
jgi:hypothetical protein